VPAGNEKLLPGKLAGRFNIRTQQWELVQWRSKAFANGKVQVLSLLEGLPALSLILFDLGYFSFAWLDYLTQMQYWFVCRLREKVSYRIVHTYYRHEGTLDALVWVGAYRTQCCGEMLRLVRFYDGTALRTYLTNVLDPTQLSMSQVAHLYARRWDIELAFLTLKKHLGLRHWWSSQSILIQQQCLVVLIVAQLLQALRMQIAAEAGVDPFEVSLPLLVEYVPYFITSRQSSLHWVLTHGKSLGFIRPSSRYVPVVPAIPTHAMTFPSMPIKLTRPARYLEYVPLEQCSDPVSPNVSKTATAKKRAAAKTSPHKQSDATASNASKTAAAKKCAAAKTSSHKQPDAVAHHASKTDSSTTKHSPVKASSHEQYDTLSLNASKTAPAKEPTPPKISFPKYSLVDS